MSSIAAVSLKMKSSGKSMVRPLLEGSSKKLSFNQDILYLLGEELSGELNYLKQPRFSNHNSSLNYRSSRTSHMRKRNSVLFKHFNQQMTTTNKTLKVSDHQESQEQK